MINSNSDMIDRRMRRAWRVHYVRNKIISMPDFFNDSASLFRDEYYRTGGHTIQLEYDLLPWNPEPMYDEDVSEMSEEEKLKHLVWPGDKLEIRALPNNWVDVSGNCSENGMVPHTFEQDCKGGRLKIRTLFGGLDRKYDAVRISYRYGQAPDPDRPALVTNGVYDPDNGLNVSCPEAIRRLCVLMTAVQILNTQFFLKVGMGGDISGIKEQMVRMWQEEMNSIWSSYQRIGAVHSMIQR